MAPASWSCVRAAKWFHFLVSCCSVIAFLFLTGPGLRQSNSGKGGQIGVCGVKVSGKLLVEDGRHIPHIQIVVVLHAAASPPSVQTEKVRKRSEEWSEGDGCGGVDHGGHVCAHY